MSVCVGGGGGGEGGRLVGGCPTVNFVDLFLSLILMY